MRARARACSNLALVKYWGKRDEARVLPFTGSLSVTLDALRTETEVEFTSSEGRDTLELDGAAAADAETARAAHLLDLVRALRPGLGAARVTSRSTFPVAAGLASSASGFAALATAACAAAGLAPSPDELSILARRASGSACRSIPAGFVEWARGTREDGGDSVARTLLAPGEWDLAVVVALVRAGRKERSSRDAMRDSAQTSPFFEAWVRTTTADLAEAKAALAARELPRLGAIAERSFLRMHATAMSAEPPSIFWRGATLDLLAAVRELRAGGTGAWASVDAGPHVAVLCAGPIAPRVAATLAQVPGVERTLTARPGPGAQVLESDAPGGSGAA
jgi:diphosphomevalonate decarboxylase